MLKFLSLFFACLIAGPVFAANADDILGEWLTAEGKSRVAIYRCGNMYCGKIVWLKNPLYTQADDVDASLLGKPKIDINNPMKSLRKAPLIDLDILKGFRYSGDGEWEGGRFTTLRTEKPIPVF